MIRSIPILLYHHVAPDREITPEGLERQLKHLLDQGYVSRSLDEVLRYIDGEAAFPGPSFTVTFDDGYLDNWVYAFPILKKLNVKATMYLVTDRVESGVGRRGPSDAQNTQSNERAKGGFLAWSEIEAMASSELVTFGSHTRTHRRFNRREKFLNLDSELRDSKALIETQLNRPCDHLAWPWGDFETSWLDLVRKLGYRSAVTTLAGANAPGQSPYWLRRISVRRDSVEWLDARLRWNQGAWRARAFGLFYGWDRRLKTWWNSETPYAHG